jgi:hypothetical protein
LIAAMGLKIIPAFAHRYQKHDYKSYKKLIV